MKKTRSAYLALVAVLLTPMAANSTPVDVSPITSDYYIEFGGLLWAWAAPISSEEWFGINILYGPEIQDGWREATADEWAARPMPSDFGTSGDFKCASRFWNSNFTHCDYSDAESGYVTNNRTFGDENFYELWYVKSSAVPEPGTLALFGLGLLGMAAARRGKKA